MKLKLLFFAILMFFAINVSYAQKGSPQEKAKTYTENLKKQLKLNNDQVRKIYDINEKANIRLEKAKGAEEKGVKQERIKAISAVLTEDQKKVFEKNFANGKN